MFSIAEHRIAARAVPFCETYIRGTGFKLEAFEFLKEEDVSTDWYVSDLWYSVVVGSSRTWCCLRDTEEQ